MQTHETPAQLSDETASSTVAPTGKFLRNTWYPILWSSDLAADALIGRVVLEEPLVFFRKDDGAPAAIVDMCPHRFAPLHLGKRRPGDRIQCLYHGLEFDATGACAFNPHGDGRIPANSTVRSYPMVEKHKILWVWMGHRTADPALIPDFSVFDTADESALTKFDYIPMAANYELTTDNLMDLSHTAFLHEGLLGNEHTVRGEVSVRQEGNAVIVSRYNRNVPVVAVHDLVFRQDGKPVDTWDSIRWDAPGCFLLDVGAHAPGATKAQGSGLYAVHLLTPETATSTHYNFSAVRQNMSAGARPSPEISRKIGEMRRDIFINQDAMIIEAQQENIRRYPERTKRPALFSTDAGPARQRRVLRALLAADVD
jgi:phenylpropionate dioxygenase-like ring-hydroxylating dioxygenase large terminal subunit